MRDADLDHAAMMDRLRAIQRESRERMAELWRVAAREDYLRRCGPAYPDPRRDFLIRDRGATCETT